MNSFAHSIVCTFLLLAVCFAAEPPKDTKPATPAIQPGHLELTLKAWEAHEKNNHAEALKAAEKCITAFEAPAAKLQEKFEKEKVTTPVGEVSAEEKKAIEGNGVLNDVAACQIIRGLSLVALKKNDDARSAFKAAEKLSHARVWDPQGWFWSPAEKAKEELENLK